jgi:hypothetical protein
VWLVAAAVQLLRVPVLPMGVWQVVAAMHALPAAVVVTWAAMQLMGVCWVQLPTQASRIPHMSS